MGELTEGTLKRLSFDSAERAINFCIKSSEGKTHITGGRFKIFLPYIESIGENLPLRWKEINRDIVCKEAILRTLLRDIDTELEIRKVLIWHLNDINLFRDICAMKKSHLSKKETAKAEYLDWILAELNISRQYLQDELKKIEEKIFSMKSTQERSHNTLMEMRNRLLN
ncbi:MAG: hypothetical protein KBD26_01850 [Candidatus Pacebacteria bacterium]|nr:hypothetical protein [Candidatus Paceibacterota bacterium]MBP9772554.1 hypothetical protein [Candidatus Paceibacterota bacterium]